MSQQKWPVAIIGSGNIGTDLMIKVLRSDGPLTVQTMVGIDPDSDGLARARRMGVATTAEGIDGLLAMPEFTDVKLVFDATSAGAHKANWAKLDGTGVRVVDLTPAAIGPYCVPVVNLDDHLDAPNLNMVTCGGQATVPVVAAVSDVGIVSYAEIVSSISSKSAGPGTRASLDEFTETTAKALEVVGGAQRGKVGLAVEADVDRAPRRCRFQAACGGVGADLPKQEALVALFPIMKASDGAGIGGALPAGDTFLVPALVPVDVAEQDGLGLGGEQGARRELVVGTGHRHAVFGHAAEHGAVGNQRGRNALPPGQPMSGREPCEQPRQLLAHRLAGIRGPHRGRHHGLVDRRHARHQQSDPGRDSFEAPAP